MAEDFNLDLGIRPASERIVGERAQRVAWSKRILSFGVAYLDIALGGIMPHDLILIGAKTGTGKTALASAIADTTAAAGKRVDYFALEGEPSEIERRMKYRIIAQLAYEQLPMLQRRGMCYTAWYSGRLDSMLGRFEDEADRLLSERSRSLHTFYRLQDFTLEDLEKKLLAIQSLTDLIILDHLHYIDSDDPNENRAYKIISKGIRNIALSIGKPVILVAHVRKSDRRVKTKVPTLDDFHGTSDVPKIATRAIMLGPAEDVPSGHGLWSTYIHVAKNRLDGDRTRYLAVVPFDPRKNSYRQDFQLGRLKDFGETFEQLSPDEMPEWAMTT